MAGSVRALVCGAGGFIGGHLVKRLKAEGQWVRGVDLEHHEFTDLPADEFVIGDLRDPRIWAHVLSGIDEVYQLAADMGGAGYLFTGENDGAVMHNSAIVNLNVVEGIRRLMQSDFPGPVNIGSDEMVSINELAEQVRKSASPTT